MSTTITIRPGQVQILKVLARNSKPLTRASIAEKVDFNVASLTRYIGSDDPGTREANDRDFFVSLVTHGFVVHMFDERLGTVHSITKKGLKFLTSLKD